MSEEYLENLLVLSRKIAFINTDDAARTSQARRDVEGVLEKLRTRAIAKVGGLGWLKLAGLLPMLHGQL